MEMYYNTHVLKLLSGTTTANTRRSKVNLMLNLLLICAHGWKCSRQEVGLFNVGDSKAVLIATAYVRCYYSIK